MAQEEKREIPPGTAARQGRWRLLGGAVGVAALGAILVVALRGRGPAAVPVAAAVAPATAATGEPDKPLRVLLQGPSGRGWFTLPMGAGGTATDPRTGKLLAHLPAGDLVVSADYENQRVLVTGRGVKAWEPEVRLASKSGMVHVGSRRYPGTVVARLGGTGVELVNEVDLERYLEGVLPGELPASFALEAQKALAVAARTYALRNRGKHGASGADVCDGVHCQMYLGYSQASPRGTQAVRETHGLFAWYRDDLVCTFYSADCGGQSTSAAFVPLKDMPKELPEYLRPVLDRPGPGAPDYCAASPSHWWSADLPRARLEARLNQDPELWIGTLKSVDFTGRDASGRVTTVRLQGEDRSALAFDPAAPATPMVRTMTGWAFRRLVGPRRLKSTLMRVARQTPDRIRITGTGYGHGLGLCQIGANGMAKPPYRRGFREILLHYYPGVEIGPHPVATARAAARAPA